MRPAELIRMKKQQKAPRGVWEAAIKMVLEQRGGCATVAEIALDLEILNDEKKRRYLRLILHRMAEKGVIERRATGYYCLPQDQKQE